MNADLADQRRLNHRPPLCGSLPAEASCAQLLSASRWLAARVLWLAGPAACLWMLAYMALRTAQAYPLDAFEEYELLKALRWSQGISLYCSPDEEVFPTAYPPLHYWMLAAWVRLFGISYVTPRCLSLAALAGIVAVGFWELRSAADRHVSRLAFLTALLSLYPLVGKWFELCKADSLMVLFLAVAIVAGEHRTWPQVLIGSAALLLATLTKQNAPLFILPLSIAHVLNRRWRWAVVWGGTMTLAVAGTYLLLNHSLGGWFFYWVFPWTAGHGIDLLGGAQRALQAILSRGPLLLVLFVGSVLLRPRDHWTWCLITALLVAVVGLAKFGGLTNHLFPAAFIAATLLGRWLGALWVQGQPKHAHGPHDLSLPVTVNTKDRFRLEGVRNPGASNRLVPFTPAHRPGGARGWGEGARHQFRRFLTLSCTNIFSGRTALCRLAVLLILFAVVWPGLPHKRDFRWVWKRAEEAAQWVEAVRQLEGQVAVGHHVLLARRAGAACFFSDLILEFPGLRVPSGVRTALRSEQFDYLLLQTDPERSATPGWHDLIRAHYELAGELDSPNRSGLLPRRLYVARRPGSRGQ